MCLLWLLPLMVHRGASFRSHIYLISYRLVSPSRWKLDSERRTAGRKWTEWKRKSSFPHFPTRVSLRTMSAEGKNTWLILRRNSRSNSILSKLNEMMHGSREEGREVEWWRRFEFRILPHPRHRMTDSMSNIDHFTFHRLKTHGRRLNIGSSWWRMKKWGKKGEIHLNR